MEKSNASALPICIGLTVLLAIGLAIGILKMLPVVIIVLVLPAAVYAVYETRSESSAWAAWLILVAAIVEIVLIIAKVNVNLTGTLRVNISYLGSQAVPFSDIKAALPIVMAILSGILFARTQSIYAKWAVALVLIGSLGTVYAIDPVIFQQLLKTGASQKGIELK
jgi:hypothetical protein